MSVYVPTEWVNDQVPAINATNLNHIEEGIKTAHEEIESIVDGSTIIKVPPASETELGGVRLWVDDSDPGNIIGYIDSRPI